MLSQERIGDGTASGGGRRIIGYRPKRNYYGQDCDPCYQALKEAYMARLRGWPCPCDYDPCYFSNDPSGSHATRGGVGVGSEMRGPGSQHYGSKSSGMSNVNGQMIPDASISSGLKSEFGTSSKGYFTDGANGPSQGMGPSGGLPDGDSGFGSDTSQSLEILPDGTSRLNTRITTEATIGGQIPSTSTTSSSSSSSSGNMQSSSPLYDTGYEHDSTYGNGQTTREPIGRLPSESQMSYEQRTNLRDSTGNKLKSENTINMDSKTTNIPNYGSKFTKNGQASSPYSTEAGVGPSTFQSSYETSSSGQTGLDPKMYSPYGSKSSDCQHYDTSYSTGNKPHTPKTHEGSGQQSAQGSSQYSASRGVPNGE